MSKRKKQVTTKEEENLTVSQSTKRCSSSGRGQQYFDMIPLELIIEIFSRLMCGKSMGNCRCVSKLWSSILRGPNLNQLFPINTSEPPRFLITFQDGLNLLYFSSSQPQNPVKYSSVVATRHHNISPPVDSYVLQICLPVRGWVCHLLRGASFITAVVFNPVTGQSITSPKIITISSYRLRCYFGYDPVHNQFKVLCITSDFCRVAKKQTLQHQVLTLETGNLLWRKIEFCIPYFDVRNDDGICINGVIYYNANISQEATIVCFDVRSEKFDFIVGRGRKNTVLINYKGKLCAVYINGYNLVLWVLDAERREWSKHIYKIPLRLQELHPIYSDSFGATGKGEIVFHSDYGVGYPVYIYFYNLEKKSLVRVRVKVPKFKASRRHIGHSFTNYVEEVKLM